MNNRRNFLKSSAAAGLALPWLESMGGFAHAQSAQNARPPQRLLLIGLTLGIHREAFQPSETGRDYQASEYLQLIDEFRDQYTVISGLDHPGVHGGHGTEPRLFTGIPSHSKNTLSLDQKIAGSIGDQTRFDSLALSAGNNEFSWTASGSRIPAEKKMAKVYSRLFVNENADSSEKVLKEISHGKSILDLVNRQAKSLRPHLSSTDKDKLEEYFESVRENERRLIKSEGWVHKPKPQVDANEPSDPSDESAIVDQLRNVCDMTHLAFKTDSTRVVTFGYFRQNKVNIPGVSNAYHSLSHHGKDPGNIAQLKLVEKEFFKGLKKLLTDLKNTREGDSTLLDRTTIIVSSNLGNGSSHSNKELPVLLLGGNYNHGQHLAFEPGAAPLSNLFVSTLNQFGIADKSFGVSTGALQGLEIG